MSDVDENVEDRGAVREGLEVEEAKEVLESGVTRRVMSNGEKVGCLRSVEELYKTDGMSANPTTMKTSEKIKRR